MLQSCLINREVSHFCFADVGFCFPCERSVRCDFQIWFAGALFKNSRGTSTYHPICPETGNSCKSCALTRQKLGFSPDKLRFTPDGTKGVLLGDGRIRTYGALYQKQLPCQLNYPPRLSWVNQRLGVIATSASMNFSG